ncbi:MAG: hypothetical protein E6G35_17990 [Actinobacteria bacterium]|nr:MAG: hypothetical protein E6G35_17990 [Actinomycetota bacterium]
MPDASAQTLGYDVDSRPATLTTSLGTTRYAVDPDGNVTQVTTPGGTVEARTYDNADRLAKLTVTGPAQQAITGYTLRRDKVGNPTRVDTTLGSASRSDAFTYDKADRLTAMCYQVTTCSGASNKLSFTYDLVGNRTAKKKSGSGSFTEKYTYNAADQLQTRSGGPDGTQSYSYDQDGNTTQISSVKYGYDLDNHLSSVDDGKKHTTYTTDGAGNRLSADTTPDNGGTTTHTGYQWDVNAVLPLLASEQTGSSTTKYTYQPGGAPYTQQSGANTTLLFPDPFGNTTALTDPSGAVQRLFQLTDPFGGLQARDYTIATGRFTSVDPMANGVDQPAVAGYVYGDDNPLTHADPSGDCDWWDVQCRVTEKIYNLWQYETDGTPHTAQDRERDFGAGIIRSGAETIDGVWNGIVGIYNWNQHWQDKPGLPASVKLHLADDWDKFAGEHLGVDTNSPYYNYGAITGTVLQLFIPIGGDEAVGGRWLGGLLGRVAEKLRVPKWEPKPTVPKDEPKPPAPKPKPPTGSLEGERDFVVDDPNVPGRTITDIDHIEGNTLWEEKSATRAGNIQDWVNKHIIRKFNSYLDARQYLPAFYHNARIGFRFTSPGMDPTLRSAIDSAVAQLRQAHPNVEIVTEFA